MQRSYLKVGDKSSAGGTAIDGISETTHHGTELTYIGATVVCPACNSTGRIIAKGPRWPDDLMGKDAALEGDLCACERDPFPVMLPSQSDMTMSFERHELADMGFADNGLPIAEEPANVHWIKFVLNENGSCEGLNCRAHFADGSTRYGYFDAQNEVHFERPNSSPCEKVELLSNHEKPTGSLIESLLSAMAS